MRVLPGLLVCAAILGAAARAGAQGPVDMKRAEQDFEQALADEKAGAWEKAAGELVQARALAHKETPQLLYHLGFCHAKLGKFVLARDELAAAADHARAVGLENVATTAKAQLAEVQPHIASLALTRPAHDDVTRVTVDAFDVTARLGTDVDLDPGAHQVHVVYAHVSPVDLTVTLGDGEHRAMPIPEPAASAGAPAGTPSARTSPSGEVPAPAPAPLSTPADPGTSSTPPTPESPAAPPSTGSSNTLGWILVGGGAALLAGGAAFWVLRDGAVGTLSGDCGATQHQCPAADQSTIDRGKLDDALAVTLFAAGGVAAVAGAGLLVFGGSHGTPATGVTVTPAIGARTVGLGVHGALW